MHIVPEYHKITKFPTVLHFGSFGFSRLLKDSLQLRLKLGTQVKDTETGG